MEKETHYTLVIIGALVVASVATMMLTAHSCSLLDRAYDFRFADEKKPILRVCKL